MTNTPSHVPNLTGVPETMLWTLYNRASEAARPDGMIDDPDALRILKALDYDFQTAFGKPDPVHAMRSLIFDEAINRFLVKHPNGVIINLGEGLETQRYRIVHPKAYWVTVDLPEAIVLRERFMQPDLQHLHLAQSVTDVSWLEQIPAERPVILTAQGLLMYLQPAEVKQLLQTFAQSFAGATFLFDAVPRWVSEKSLKGWHKTPRYRVPAMPWGTDLATLTADLANWTPGAQLKLIDFRFPRGLKAWVLPLLTKIPALRNKMPGIYTLQFASDSSQTSPEQK